jgi:hypothetical protein
MPDALPDPPKITAAELRGIVSDGEELAKGARIFDDKGLSHLSRHGNKLFADAKGSGASPYKVQLAFGDTIRGRCSCMAARSRPFCKHAAGLLVAWSRAPEAFAVSDLAPADAGRSEAKKKAVKVGKVDGRALLRGGVEQAATLIRELGVTGVASVSSDRADQVEALGAALRESRLRRLSARTLRLSDHIAAAASPTRAFDAAEYADLYADVVLTVRKLEKHLAGEELAPEHVEELIGKTWTKKDRAPIAGLELVEYAYQVRTTPDDYLIRESRFLDLASGDHFSEKQILPQMLVKRTEPKKSHGGWLLSGAAGSRYPTYAPVRIDLESHGNRVLVGHAEHAALDRLRDKCLENVTAALKAFQERSKDVFAPEALPVAIAVEMIVAEGARLQVVDGEDGALCRRDRRRERCPREQKSAPGPCAGGEADELLGRCRPRRWHELRGDRAG